MTPHPNLTKTLLVFGLSACISTMPAQQTSTSGQSSQSGQSSGQTTDRNTTRSKTSTQTGTPGNTTGTSAGDRSHGASADRNRTTGSSELMVNPTDQAFMHEAAMSGLMEVQAATIAQQKAQSPEVKQFAQQLLADHTKANQELQSLAAQKNVTLPTDMGPKHQAQIAKMQNLSDAQFDRQWIKMQIDHHKKDVREFQKESDRGMDSHVKEFTAKTLPTLQQHLQTAQNLQQTATRSRSANTSSSNTSSKASDSTSGSTSGAAGKGPSSDTNNQGNNDATRKSQGQNNPTTQR